MILTSIHITSSRHGCFLKLLLYSPFNEQLLHIWRNADTSGTLQELVLGISHENEGRGRTE